MKERREPSDELKSVAPPHRLPSLFPLSEWAYASSPRPIRQQGEEGGGGEKREEEGQDQQPPGLAAHRSCHSWEGRMEGREEEEGREEGAGGGGWRGSK